MNRRSSMSSSLCIAAILVAASLNAKDLKPTSFRGVYQLMVDAEDIAPVPACAAASSIGFEDARAEEAVGERFHEKKPELKLPISMTGSVVEWLESGFRELARRAVLTSAPDRPRVAIRLASLWVDESVYRRAEYDARIVFDVEVTAPESGASCWTGRVDGFAENYGRAGKEVNYQETVNHALDRAVLDLFGAAEFTDALCSCGS